jgi:DNA-binding transcriptional regulator YiaG
MNKEIQEFRRLLARSGLNQSTLAYLLGKDVGTVNRWHQGRTPVPAYALAYLELRCKLNKMSEQLTQA